MAVVGLMFTGGVVAAAQEKAPPPKPTLTPLKVQVVLTRYSGDKKLSSMPYTIPVNANPRPRDSGVSLRIGTEVPVIVHTVTGKDGTASIPSFNYRHVGTNIDCFAAPTDDGRFNVHLSIEQSSIDEENPPRRLAAAPPGLRSFKSSFEVMLKDGQSAQYVSATDPASGDVLKVDVTLNVIK